MNAYPARVLPVSGFGGANGSKRAKGGTAPLFNLIIRNFLFFWFKKIEKKDSPG